MAKKCERRPSAGPLRAKAGKTMLARAAAGLLGMLPEALAMCDKWRQQAPARVLPALQGNGPRAQRSVAADLIFGSFHQGKEQSLPAAIERVRTQTVNTDFQKQEV